MMNSDARTITARDLLLEFLELRSLSPKLEDWTEEALANNAPRLIRLRRLAALFRAFELPWDPSEFMEGGFIQPDDPRYSTVLAKVVSELPECARRRGGHKHELPECFAILFEFRERVDKILSFTGQWYEAFGLILVALRRAGELNRTIRDSLSGIESLLEEIIDPDGRTFAVRQLTEYFGYPDVDLSSIDADWQ